MITKKSTINLFLSASCYFLLVPKNARSEWRTPYRDHEWQSPAINSLGGIGTLSPDPVDQVFSDPAVSALPRKQNFQLQWFGTTVMVSRDLTSTVSDLQSFATTGTQSTSDESSRTLSTVKKLFGRKLSGGLALSVMATRAGGFSFFPLVNVLTESGLRVPSYPQARVYVDGNTGIVTNYARSLGAGFDAGISVKSLVRFYEAFEKNLSDLVPSGTLGNTTSGSTTSDLKPRYALLLPVDLGVGYNAVPNTRIYANVMNVGQSPVLLKLSDSPSPQYLSRMNLGATYKAFQQGGHSVQVATELQDMAGLSQPSGFLYRWQWAGQYEFRPGSRVQPLFGFNAGLQAGYPSVGIHLDLILAKLEAALHTKETGYYLGQSPERRYSFRLYSQMSF